MNDRIKELITQATTEEHDGFLYFDKEKFANLIIDVCVKIASETDYILSDHEIYTVETKIEQYFGS